MSFGHFLLEQGVEVELQADLKEVIDALDDEVPRFAHGAYTFRISPMGGVVGSKWRLWVSPWYPGNATETVPPVALIEVDKLVGGGVSFRMPNRDGWANAETKSFDEEGEFFSSFAFQILNAFQGRGLIDLAGQFPVR